MDEYRVGSFEAPRAEASRLHGHVQRIGVQERAALAAVGLPVRGHGLEVGCGLGLFAEALRRDDLGRKIVGLDLEPPALREARHRLPVVRGDAASGALPFPEACFDFVYSRLFLRHVPDPPRALRAMAALVKPGGSVAAIDSSDTSLMLDPVPLDFAVIAAARSEWFTRRGCSANVGHRLPGLFVRAGLRDTRVRTVVLDTATVGAEAFAHLVLTPFLQAAAPIMDEPARQAAATAAVERWATAPDSYGAITLFVVGGKR